MTPALGLLVDLAKTMGAEFASQDEPALATVLVAMEPFGRYPDLIPDIVRKLKSTS